MRQQTGFAAVLRLAVGVAGFAASAAAWGQAVAELKPTAGNSASGTVQFTQAGNKVRISGTIRGLTPAAEHGFHVHEKGDCTAPDATSAGGHFNPDGQPHGHPQRGKHHAGDMPMLKADANGTATINHETDRLTLAAGPNGVVGRAVVVHRDVDDFKSQPAGNSGPRIACGVVVAK